MYMYEYDVQRYVNMCQISWHMHKQVLQYRQMSDIYYMYI